MSHDGLQENKLSWRLGRGCRSSQMCARRGGGIDLWWGGNTNPRGGQALGTFVWVGRGAATCRVGATATQESLKETTGTGK